MKLPDGSSTLRTMAMASGLAIYKVKRFRPKVTMKSATSDNIIIPEAQGYLQVSTITKGVTIDVLCYYSPEFTSTLLSDNDILLSNNNASDYVGQSMLKLFLSKMNLTRWKSYQFLT